MEGKWYEVAYEDIAQVGASCQTMTNSVTDEGYEQEFKAKYSLIPFT